MHVYPWFLGSCISAASYPSPSSLCIYLITSRPDSGSRVAAPHAFAGSDLAGPQISATQLSAVSDHISPPLRPSKGEDHQMPARRRAGKRGGDGQTTSEVPVSDQTATAPDHGTDAPDSTMAETHTSDAPEGEEKNEKPDLRLLCWYVSSLVVPLLSQCSSSFHCFVPFLSDLILDTAAWRPSRNRHPVPRLGIRLEHKRTPTET